MAAVAVLISAMAGMFALSGSAGATSPGDVQADLFRLLNAATDQCADLPAEVEIGREVVQQPCVGEPTQVWRAQQVPTSFDFRIVNNTNGLCMDLRRAGSGDPMPVVLAQCSGKLASQEWQFALTSGFPGPLKVVNLLTGLCLEVKDGSLAAGAPLQVSTCDDSVAHQEWFKLPGRVLA